MTESEKTIQQLEEGMETAKFQSAVTEHNVGLGTTIEVYARLHNLGDQEVAYLLCFHAGRLIAGAPREMQDVLINQHQYVVAQTVKLTRESK
jgi:hypothetical protein